jgi:hypothetical protein
MKKIVLAVLPFLLAGGCADINNIKTAISVASGASVNPNTVLVAGNSFVALETTATAYIKLPTCGTSGATVICKTSAAVAVIVPAVRAARIAVANLEALIKANPTAAIPIGNWDIFQAAIKTLTSIEAQYGLTVN